MPAADVNLRQYVSVPQAQRTKKKHAKKNKKITTDSGLSCETPGSLLQSYRASATYDVATDEADITSSGECQEPKRPIAGADLSWRDQATENEAINTVNGRR